MGFSQLLLNKSKEYSDEKINTTLQYIYNASKNGNNLLDNLLQWSRTETGRISFEQTKVSLLMIVEETKDFLEGDANRKKIHIETHIDPRLEVMADENMLKTVIRNLLSNAIKFTYEKGTIHISSQLNDSSVIIAVKDNGTGIPADKIPQLFNLDNNMLKKGTANETGTGLGLMLCKEFIERHGGKIWVESEVGKGSEFKFTLPWG